jgi:hypothetical protein
MRFVVLRRCNPVAVFLVLRQVPMQVLIFALHAIYMMHN